MQTEPTDNEIIRRVLQGDQQAYAILVKRYQPFVFTLSMRYTPIRENAEEIAQDVFIKAYRCLSDFRGDSKFSTWLYTIVNSTSLTFLRKKKLNIKSLDDEYVFSAAGNIEAGMHANQVEQKSKISMVNGAIRLLQAEDAKIITLFYQAEQSLDEIGKIMGIDPNTAKVKLHRARQKLKDKIEKHYAAELKDLV